MAKRGRVIFRSHAPKAKKAAERAWRIAAKKIAQEMQVAIKNSVSRKYPPASRPGGLPHMRSEQLRSGINVEGGKTLTIRSIAEHGIYLEGGTSNMAARPWGRRQFEGNLGKKWARKLRLEMMRVMKRDYRRK